MPFVQTKETTRIYPPETLKGVSKGDWVEISTVYTSAIRRKVMGRAMAVASSAASPGQPGITYDIFEYRQALLEEVIESWSDSAEVTPENIGLTPPELQDWIAEQYDQAVKGRADDEKKESSNGSEPIMAPAEDLSPASLGT